MYNYSITSVTPNNRFAQNKIKELLAQEDIRLDQNLDYTCAIFDSQGQAIATGSYFHNTLRCLAVSSKHQGEGLMNRIVSHLVNELSLQGLTHLFLYTKIDSGQLFSQLGFYEICRVEGNLVFMENRRDGFQSYLDSLIPAPAGANSIAALVMNCNPITLGHQFLIEKAAAENDHVHLFLLEEDASIFPYTVRRQLVEEACQHLDNLTIQPTADYIISQATFPSYFQADSEAVIAGHSLLDAKLFLQIAERLNIQKRYVGEEPYSKMTATYNQVLTEVLDGAGIELVIVPRKTQNGQAISASNVRSAVAKDDWEFVEASTPATTLAYLQSPQAAPVIERIKSCLSLTHH